MDDIFENLCKWAFAKLSEAGPWLQAAWGTALVTAYLWLGTFAAILVVAYWRPPLRGRLVVYRPDNSGKPPRPAVPLARKATY